MTRAAARVAHIIDGDSMSLTRAGFTIDWRRLRNHVLTSNPNDITTFCFNGVEYFREDGLASNRRLIDFLSMNGYRVRTTPASVGAEGDIQRARTKVMVGLAIDMVQAGATAQEIILWTGDGAATPAIEAAQILGASVTVIAIGAWCAGSLKTEADNFIDLATLRRDIERIHADTTA